MSMSVEEFSKILEETNKNITLEQIDEYMRAKGLFARPSPNRHGLEYNMPIAKQLIEMESKNKAHRLIQQYEPFKQTIEREEILKLRRMIERELFKLTRDNSIAITSREHIIERNFNFTTSIVQLKEYVKYLVYLRRTRTKEKLEKYKFEKYRKKLLDYNDSDFPELAVDMGVNK